ncbi:MAG: hypothetical protein MPJ50_19095 [Pirellulales bacterium]|nr:hypothetical protein [Pirellulales bacterium]
MFSSNDPLAISLTIAVAFMLCAIVSAMRLPSGVKVIVSLAVALRFAGAYARQLMAADAIVYFRWGETYAYYFSRLDFSPLISPDLWRSQSWYGTNFMGYIAGLVMTFVGSSWLGTFFAFGLISFLGLVAYAIAYRRSFPGAPYKAYWAWIFLLPSLWFWPSSIGKESVMMVGLGVATLGFAGKHGRSNWAVVLAGLALTFCIRPQVVVVFLFAAVLSAWLQFEAWSSKKVLQAVALFVFGCAGMWFALSTTLDGEVDAETVEKYIDSNAARNNNGGSSVEGVGIGPSSIVLAPVNVLFRPFVWEAHNLSSLASAIELLFIWGLIFVRRREVIAAVRMWRQHRMLRFAVPFVTFYVVGLGMNLSNLGLLARQRVLVFPLLFMIVEAGSYVRQRSKLARVRTLRHRPQLYPWQPNHPLPLKGVLARPMHPPHA